MTRTNESKLQSIALLNNHAVRLHQMNERSAAAPLYHRALMAMRECVWNEDADHDEISSASSTMLCGDVETKPGKPITAISAHLVEGCHEKEPLEHYILSNFSSPGHTAESLICAPILVRDIMFAGSDSEEAVTVAVLYNLSLLHFEENSLVLASEFLRMALSLLPSEGISSSEVEQVWHSVHYLLGCICSLMGRENDAFVEFLTIIRMRSTFCDVLPRMNAIRASAMSRVGTFLFSRGYVHDAQEASHNAVLIGIRHVTGTTSSKLYGTAESGAPAA